MTQPTITSDVINVESTPDTSDLSTDNSTTAQLGIDAVYTGTGEDMLGYAQVAITLHSDVDSTEGGMQFQWSMDNTNWDDVYSFHMHVSNSTTRRFQFPVCARYFRVKYTNGGTETADLRIQTILHRGNILTSIHSIGAEVVHDRSCQLMKSVIVGETTAGGGGYVNVKVEPSGALAIEDANSADILTAAQAIQAAVEIMDDWDESNRAKVNIIAGQAGIAANAGAVGATVPRVTLASDDPLVVEVQDALADYFFSGYVVSGTAVYLGYEDKAGVYYVQYIETSTGVVTYAVGSGGIVAPGSYSGLSYGSFASKF